jgi:hypothetical protein
LLNGQNLPFHINIADTKFTLAKFVGENVSDIASLPSLPWACLRRTAKGGQGKYNHVSLLLGLSR